jgi:hypothetical protein
MDMEKRGPKKMRRKGEKKSKVGNGVGSKRGRDNGERDQHKSERDMHKNERDTGERDQHKSERNSHKSERDMHKNKIPSSPSPPPHARSSHPPNIPLTPYQVLGLPPSSSKDQIDKAFTKLRLKYHPDRKTGDRNKYDQIVEAYNEIKNKKEEDREYLEVNSFIKNYKDSEEEIRDLLDLYKKFQGNYKKIIKYHLLTEEEDEERIRGIIEREIIKKGGDEDGGSEDVNVDKGKPNGTTPSKNILNKKRIKEKKKAEQLALEMGIDLNQSLEEILNKGKKKERKFLEDLERKYLRRLE